MGRLRGRRRLFAALAGAGLVAGGTLGWATSAQAASDGCKISYSARYCAFVDSDNPDEVTESVGVTLDTVEQGDHYNVSARISHLPINRWLTTSTVYIRQCRGDGTHCGTVAANSKEDQVSYRTSYRTTANGHIYRACASWTTEWGWHEVNKCSPWLADAS